MKPEIKTYLARYIIQLPRYRCDKRLLEKLVFADNWPDPWWMGVRIVEARKREAYDEANAMMHWLMIDFGLRNGLLPVTGKLETAVARRIPDTDFDLHDHSFWFRSCPTTGGIGRDERVALVAQPYVGGAIRVDRFFRMPPRSHIAKAMERCREGNLSLSFPRYPAWWSPVDPCIVLTLFESAAALVKEMPEPKRRRGWDEDLTVYAKALNKVIHEKLVGSLSNEHDLLAVSAIGVGLKNRMDVIENPALKAAYRRQLDKAGRLSRNIEYWMDRR